MRWSRRVTVAASSGVFGLAPDAFVRRVALAAIFSACLAGSVSHAQPSPTSPPASSAARSQRPGGTPAGTSAAAAREVPVPADAWPGSLRVPGGTAALLTAAGLGPSRPRATALLDVIRVIHAVREGVQAPVDERRNALYAYLQAIADFERARALFPSGAVSLAGAAQNKNLRKALEELAKSVGSSLEEDNKIYRFQPVGGAGSQQRRSALLAAGLEVSKFETALNKGGNPTPALSADDVPLVFPEAVWRTVIAAGSGDAGPLVVSLLTDRNASLFYHGAFSMDAETRRYVAATPPLLNDLRSADRAAILALYGQSLRVRDGRMDTPGGAAATGLWEAVLDERIARPDRFITRVIDKDGGRFAMLYDAVSHFDVPHQAFALGLWLGDPNLRLERFKALNSSTATALSGWDPVARPFARVLYDPAHLMMLTPVAPNGAPESLPWRRFWEKAFDGDDLPDRPENEVKNVEKDGVFDAAWMIDTVLLANARLRTERVETWLYGHRVFGSTPVASLPQAFVAVRGFTRFRTLAGTLERLGVIDPAVCAAAVRQAQRIAEIGDRERAATALALFQGALVLVERARLSRTIDASAARALVDSLSRLVLADGSEYLGGVAAWIDEAFLPGVGIRAGAPVGVGGARLLETDLLAALVGGRPSAVGVSASRVVEHESARYRLDPSVFELARVRAIRAKQGGGSVDAELAFAREALAIARGIPDLSQIPTRVAGLRAAAGPLLGGPKSELAGEVTDAVEELMKIKKAKDLSKAERIAVPLRKAVDAGFARLLTSLAYACSLADPDSTLLVAGDPATLHDWGVQESDAKIRVRAAWALGSETRDAQARWRLTGSLLALDVALGDQALRRITSDAPPDVPTVYDNDRAALTEAVVLANPYDYRDADMGALANAMRRGRATVAVLASIPSTLPDVAAAAALDETRRQAIAWSLHHDREQVPGFFSLGDLVRLGRLSIDALEAPDAWGTSGLSYDGRLGLRYPTSEPWSTLAGRKGKGLIPALLPDLALLAAETLSDQRLPAALTRHVLAVATRDYMDRAQLGYLDDWLAMVREVQRLLPPRMDDYLAAVMTGGPLVPLSKSEGER
jgi:hypothetical protein